MYYLRWLFSRTLRKASELEDTVRKLLNHQRDILAPQAVQAMEEALAEYRKITRGGAPHSSILDAMDNLESTAGKWLRPYPNPGIRENILMLLEIAVLIVGSRAFLIQPMVIPTGSAHPLGRHLRGSPGYQHAGAVVADADLGEGRLRGQLLPDHGSRGSRDHQLG
jgi:hypothetical protein